MQKLQKYRSYIWAETLTGSGCEPDWIRTNDLLLRRQLLYPTELPVRKGAKIAHFLAMCTPEITLFMRISLSKPQPGRADYTIQKLHFII